MYRSRGRFPRSSPVSRRGSLLIWVSLFFLMAALILAILQLVTYSRIRTNFPAGMVIANVPVGGMDRQQAADRLLEAYAIPIELHYNDSIVHMEPGIVGFELDLDSMLAVADLQRSEQSFWIGFWDFLWGRAQDTQAVPLRASFSEERLRTYLSGEIRPRYDQPASSARPAVGTVNFLAGTPGTAVNVDESVLLVEQALNSNTSRVVVLPLERTAPTRLAFENLTFFLTQAIDREGYDGLVGYYLLDLQTAQEIHFAYQRGEFLSTQPDVAFTAASIIKVPIMVSVFQRTNAEADVETNNLIQSMIELSGNDPADWVMERVIDPTLGPLMVSDDMQALGLESTFLAGHFYIGAPLLANIETPANQRIDIDTDPDRYNQTTTSEMGMLLSDIYQCANGGGGALAAIYAGAVTQEECQLMISYLIRNRLPVLLTAGLPEGTQIAHKHGWVTDGSGVINTIGDAGVIYSPGGNYVLVIFLYHPVQLVWDPSSALIELLSEATFNYYNIQQ
jgi:hypothetical protein